MPTWMSVAPPSRTLKCVLSACSLPARSFFIYAIIGVNLFAGIKYGQALNSHANFDRFANAMLVGTTQMQTTAWWGPIHLVCTRACAIGFTSNLILCPCFCFLSLLHNPLLVTAAVQVSILTQGPIRICSPH